MLATEAVMSIMVVLSICATIFGIFYFRTRENLMMIERGLNPKERRQSISFISLKYGLLLAGVGLGLLAAYWLDVIVLHHGDAYIKEVTENGITRVINEREPAIYFALLFIGGGLGLILSYAVEKKNNSKAKGGRGE